jgi:iron complex outermembrane receptor protein
MSFPLKSLSTLTSLSVALAAPLTLASTTTNTDELGDLTELSLEELLNIEVTVVSRSEQALSEVPGAVYVLSGDEIRRSGHNSIQEALRMVPGMYVSNWTTSKWDVTSRGFGTGLSLSSLAYLNQLMVMVDGVPVNSSVFVGMDWALLDLDMESIDRIEIIRGPGGILWGSNAVHGVVHIITKNTADTHGVQSSLRGQNDERHYTVRNGGSFGETGNYRFFAKHSAFDANRNPWLGIDTAFSIDTFGARFDWTGRDDYKNKAWGKYYAAQINNDGFDLDIFDYVPVEDHDYGFQAFASSTSPDGKQSFTGWITGDRQRQLTELDSDVLSIDLEYKRTFSFSETSNLSTGLGYHLLKSNLVGDDPFFLDFAPRRQVLNTFRGFAVQTWNLMEHDLDVVLGAQIENNDTSGTEVQPTARISWHPGGRYTIWAAATRSVRTPALEEISLSPDSAMVGNPGFDSEKVRSYELGFRDQLNDTTAIDVALYYNQYDDLHDEEFDPFTFQSILTNNGEGWSKGLELAVDSKPTDSWNLRGAYTFSTGRYTNKVTGDQLGTNDYHPDQQFNLRSYYDINDQWSFDSAFYLSGDFGNMFGIDDRNRLDVHFSFEPREGLEFAFGGQQIARPYQSELDDFDTPRRDLYISMTWSPAH